MLQLVSEKTQSLKDFTENNYAQAAFFWNALLKSREIKVNGKRTDRDVTIYKGDVVCYYLTPKQEGKAPFATIFEDEYIRIIDKDSGVNSEAVFAALSREGEYYFIHRLDRNTRGLLVFAKKEEAEKELLAAFKRHAVEKRYHALCFGCFPENNGILTAYLKKNEEKSLVKIYDTPVRDSEKIITEYRVLREEEGFTKAEILLHTGKTHQIRAHLAHVGCPIVGDMKYGNTEANKRLKVARQCLVAKYLAFSCGGVLSYLNGKQFASRYQAEL